MYTRVLAIGKVKNVKSAETAKGEPMISFGLSTSDGMFSVRQFGEQASAVNLQNDSVVIVEGKLKVYNQQVYILADNIRPLDDEGKEQKEKEPKPWNNQGYNKHYQ
jgi:DNA polymerase III alpha subunit